jgi:hypothetical protein
MRVLVRPIRYTSRVAAMRHWAIRLGLVPLAEMPGWLVLGAGSGRLAVHEVPQGDALDGVTTLAVETDDLAALERHWRDAGLATRRTDERGIPLLFVAAPFGGEIAAGELSPAPTEPARDPDLAVMPMLTTADVPAAVDWLLAGGLPGLRRRISSQGGGWADLEMADGGGLVAVHATHNLEGDPPPAVLDPSTGTGELPVWLSFEHPDVDGLLARVRAAGLTDARVHDEAYNRTLVTVTPDGDEVWVNGEMADLYGYRRD